MVDTTVRAGFVKGDVQLVVPNQFQISSGTVGVFSQCGIYFLKETGNKCSFCGLVGHLGLRNARTSDVVTWEVMHSMA